MYCCIFIFIFLLKVFGVSPLFRTEELCPHQNHDETSETLLFEEMKLGVRDQ